MREGACVYVCASKLTSSVRSGMSLMYSVRKRCVTLDCVEKNARDGLESS